MHPHFIARLWPALLAVLALMASGCGGGGGSGAGGDQAPVEPPLASSVRLSNASYTSAKYSVFESSSPLPGVSITADVSGDLSKLNGKTLYVVVVDPDGLFEPHPTLQLGAQGIGNRLQLIGKPTQGHAGVYRGNLQVNVCVDDACKQPLGNSPLQIPYDITIAGGAKFAGASPLVVETTFGESATLPAASFGIVTTRDVAVTLPADTSSSTISTPTITGANSPFYGLSMSNGNLQIGFYDAPVGTYDGIVRVSTTSQLGGILQSSRSDLAVRYIVHANPAVNFMFRPFPQQFTAQQQSQSFKLIAADGKQYSSLSRIVYGPGGTNANGNQWLQFSAVGDVMTLTSYYCTASGFANCLYAGAIYQASVYFKTADGVELPTPLPVTLKAN